MNMGALIQVSIPCSAKCHTSIVLIAWWTDMKDGVPAQELKWLPEKDVTHMQDGDEFRAEGLFVLMLTQCC